MPNGKTLAAIPRRGRRRPAIHDIAAQGHENASRPAFAGMTASGKPGIAFIAA